MFGREPALIIGAVMSAIALAVAFGVQVSETQTEAIAKFLAALLPLVGGVTTRQMVVPVTKIEDKGLSPKTLNPVKQ